MSMAHLKHAKCPYYYQCSSIVFAGHVTEVNCSQMAEQIKIALYMRVGLGQGHVVSEWIEVP